MYKPMYSVKFCKCGMAAVSFLLYCAIKDLEEELENMDSNNWRNRWEKQRKQTKLNKLYRAYASLENGYGRRRHAIEDIGSYAYDKWLEEL